MDIVRKQIGTQKNRVKSRQTQRYRQIKVPIFTYIDSKTKKRIKDNMTLTRINKLRIPPAYKNVTISKKKNNKIQAIGIDTKGRKQYIYSKKHLVTQEGVKFSELIILGKTIEKIRYDVQKIINKIDINKNLNKTQLTAIIISLIDKCNFRVGSEKYMKLYNSYGVTTLKKKHIKKPTNKDFVEIEFIGKKGIINKALVNDTKICSLLVKLTNNKKSDNFVFQYSLGKENMRISERHVNNFLKEYNSRIKVKMFRTWNSNIILLENILAFPMPNDSKEASANVKHIIEKAAYELHHTKSVSKSSYMNNKIIDLYENDLDAFKKIIAKIKKKNKGKIPKINILLTELFINLNE